MGNKPTARDDKLMERALAEARAAIDQGKVGVAAILAWRDQVLAIGHNAYEETHDMTAHGEMTVLRQCAARLDKMSQEEKAEVTIYVTLEPCLMCLAAISFIGIKRAVYSALIEDANQEALIARGLTCDQLNSLLTKGPLELIEGVRREEGKELLARMGKAA